METEDAEIVEGLGAAFTIHRPDGDTFKISGTSLSVDVRDGCLILLTGTTISHVFSPGQWVTVNVAPVKI